MRDKVVNGIDYMDYQTCSAYEQKIFATLSQTFSNCDNRIVTNTNGIVEGVNEGIDATIQKP